MSCADPMCVRSQPARVYFQRWVRSMVSASRRTTGEISGAGSAVRTVSCAENMIACSGIRPDQRQIRDEIHVSAADDFFRFDTAACPNLVDQRIA